MKTQRLRYPVAVLALLLALVLAAQAGGVETTSGPAPSRDGWPDLEAFARAYGLAVVEAEERWAARLALDPAVQFVASHRDLFGRVWIDQAAGGVLDVAIVQDRSTGRDEIVQLLPSSAKVRWRTVERSLSDLDRIRDDLIARMPELTAAGWSVSWISIDVPRNVVVVAVEGSVSDLHRLLAEDYATGIDVVSGTRLEPVACISRSSCSPWRGGIRILPGDGKAFSAPTDTTPDRW